MQHLIYNQLNLLLLIVYYSMYRNVDRILFHKLIL